MKISNIKMKAAQITGSDLHEIHADDDAIAAALAVYVESVDAANRAYVAAAAQCPTLSQYWDIEVTHGGRSFSYKRALRSPSFPITQAASIAHDNAAHAGLVKEKAEKTRAIEAARAAFVAAVR